MRVNQTLTITAGTPIQLATVRTMVNRLFIQMLIGGTGVGYVMDGIPAGTTPSHSNATQLTAQLFAATATQPGGSYSDSATPSDAPIDISKTWIDGSHTGDTVVVSYDVRI